MKKITIVLFSVIFFIVGCYEIPEEPSEEILIISPVPKQEVEKVEYTYECTYSLMGFCLDYEWVIK